MPPLNSQVNTRLILHSVLDTKMGQVPAESYAEHTEHTQAKSHDSKRLSGDIPSSDGNHLYVEQKLALFGVALLISQPSLSG